MRRFAAAQVAAELRDGALIVGNVLVWVIWLVAAAACIGTGLRVVTAANPFSSALSLIGNLASLAVLYLLASGNAKLRPMLKRQLRPGARIVSHAFSMGPGWPADRIDQFTTERGDEITLYLWRIAD